MNLEYTFGHKYLIIMRQTIQTKQNIQITRMEIGTIDGESKHMLMLSHDGTRKSIKKNLIQAMTDISNIKHNLNPKYLIDMLEGLV